MRGAARQVHSEVRCSHTVTATRPTKAATGGIRPHDGLFGYFKETYAFRAAARRGAALGIEGKWAIHPSQIALANEIFTPPAAEVDRARRILDALDQAAKEGKGAAQLDGVTSRLQTRPRPGQGGSGLGGDGLERRRIARRPGRTGCRARSGRSQPPDDVGPGVPIS